jgi:hypothetical protein
MGRSSLFLLGDIPSSAPNKTTLLVHIAGMDLNPELNPDHVVHLPGLGSDHLSVMDLAMTFPDFYRYPRWMCQGCSLPSYHICISGPLNVNLANSQEKLSMPGVWINRSSCTGYRMFMSYN